MKVPEEWPRGKWKRWAGRPERRRLGRVPTSLETLVTHWLTVPELCERLALDAGKVRRLLAEQWLVGVRRERGVLAVPADFLQERALPPDAGARGAARWVVLPALRGTVTLLDDAGLDDEAKIVWLFSANEDLGSRPVDALRAGHKAPVRRVAQLLF